MAKLVLLDWRNILGEDGKPIDYTEEKAYSILNDPEYHLVHSFVFGVAIDESEYRREEQETESGN